MRFTYRIDEYDGVAKRAFVTYQLIGKDKLPISKWVAIADNLTKEQIDSVIVAEAPVESWTFAGNPAIVPLLNKSSGLREI